MKELVITLQLIFLLIITQAAVSQGDEGRRNSEHSNLPEVVLSPEIKSYLPDNVKYEISYKNIKPFLETVMVVENSEIAKRNLKLTLKQTKVEVNLVKDLNVSSKAGRYVIGFDKKMTNMVGRGDHILVNGLAADRYYSYALLRPRFSYYNPGSKEYLGTDLLIIGKASIVKRGNISTLHIDEAKELIEVGTLVLPGRGLNITNNLRATTSKKHFKGTILSMIPSINNAANQDIVVINLGKRDGITTGELLKVKQPDEKIDDPYSTKVQHVLPMKDPKGEIIVYDVFNKLSLGIIIKSTESINELDTVVNRL